MSNVESETGEKDTTEVVANGVTENVTEKEGAGKNDVLKSKIVRQIEYYFGDMNLPRDRFLQEQIKVDDGWVPLEVMLKFKRLASLSSDIATIVAALEEGSGDLLELNEDKTKLRRKPDKPLPAYNEERRKELMSRTVYCKGFDLQGTTMDGLLDFFNPFAGIDNVQMRSYKDKATNSYIFKGSVFVTFTTKEMAAEFLSKESVKYKDVELIRKWQSTYLEDKRNERLEKKMSKGHTKKPEEEKAVQPKEEFSRGAFLHLNGISKETTREDVKEKLISLGADVAFVDFNKGNPDAHIRLQGENSSKEFLEKLGDAKLEVCGAELEVRGLEGEEEEAYIQKTKENLEKRRQNNFKNRWNRKGGRGGRGGQGHKRKGGPLTGAPPSKKGGISGSETKADVVKITDGDD